MTHHTHYPKGMHMSCRRFTHGSLFALLCGVVTLGRALGGTAITLAVDATDAPGNILHITEAIAVSPGPLTLYYPKWIPGEHGPTGPVADVAGLHLQASGSPLPWRRDLVDMNALHCEIPDGATALDVAFDFILPPESKGFSSAGSSTPALLVLSWNQVVLYPERERPDDIAVSPTLTLRPGWDFGTSLEVTSREARVIHFTSVPLTTLIDSPVLCGAHFRSIDISADPEVPHHIDLASDGDEAIRMPATLKESYKHLVVQAGALFQSHHYRHYDFLYTLSDHTAHFGLEHHQSSDDRVDERTLIDGDKTLAFAGLLPHEFVHSWNGKFRRPADLATGDYSTPMKDDLLWVYEGLTEYLGDILTARSGLWTPEEYRENLARVAAEMDHRPGRTWRPLQDAADEASILYDAREDWEAYRRGVDFYDEGELIWLEADVVIRQRTEGRKSLDDFCRDFFGGNEGIPAIKPYTFDDVVAALSRVASYDWRSFFTSRLESLSPHAPLGGIVGGGWKLVYRDTLSPMQKARESARRAVDMRYSLGVTISEEAALKDVLPGSPAAVAGLTPTMNIIAVNGRGYSPEILREAVRDAVTGSAPVVILAEHADFYASFSIDYHGGERYPFLERDATEPDLLDQIIAPRTAP